MPAACMTHFTGTLEFLTEEDKDWVMGDRRWS
jgi:hypothetical protein